MNQTNLSLIAICLACAMTVPVIAAATPAEDRAVFQSYFKARFPTVPEDEFKNGVYAIDPSAVKTGRQSKNFHPMRMPSAMAKPCGTNRSPMARVIRTAFPMGQRSSANIPTGIESRGWS